MKVLSISGKKAVNIAPNANNVGTLEYQFGSQKIVIRLKDICVSPVKRLMTLILKN